MTAREAELRLALEIANSSLVAPEIRADARAYVDRVFNANVREIRLAALERLAETAPIESLPAITQEIRELRAQ